MTRILCSASKFELEIKLGYDLIIYRSQNQKENYLGQSSKSMSNQWFLLDKIQKQFSSYILQQRYLSYTCYRLYCKIEICLFDIIIELWISAQYLFAYYQLFIYLLVRCCNACLNKCYLLKNILFTKTYISTIYNAHHFTKFYVKLVLTLLTCVRFRMTKNPKNFGAYGVNVRPYSVARSATVAILAASFHQITSKKPFLQWKFEVTYLVYDRYILPAQISKIGIFVLVTVKRESLMNFTTRKKKYIFACHLLFVVCVQ